MNTEEKKPEVVQQQDLKLPEPKNKTKAKSSAAAPGENKTADAKAGGNDPDFGAMSAEQLREIYGEMSATVVDLGFKAEKLPDEVVPLSDLRKSCVNMHKFIQTRRAADNKKAKVDKTQKQKSQPQSEGAKAATKNKKPSDKSTDKEKTMTKKTAKKTAAKKTESKVASFAGFPLTAKVTVLNKENPAREKTDKWKRWNALLSGGARSVEALKKAKINPGTLRNAVKSRHVKVA